MEWEEVTIADIAILKNGKKRPTSQGTIPVYGGNGIMDYVDVYNDEYNIVVGRVGAYCGCVYLSKGKCWVSDNAISVKAKQGTDNKFLFYLLCNQNINHYHIGGAQPLMTQDIISRIEVSIPKSEEHQHQIAIILSALDAKIENNNKINANLEAQAEALFKSWFVDFTPFKDQPFVNSELGPIPQGWKVGTLFDVANLHDRYRRPLSSNQRSLMAKKYPYYGATSLMDFVEDYIFDGEYVLMGEDGSVVTEKGYPFIQYVWGKIWVNNHAHVLSGKDGFPTELLIPFLKTYNIKGLVTGAVQAKLNQANMAQIQIPIPPKKNINNLSVIIKSIYKKYRLLTEENQRLAALRDTLLPKLMSGEIKL
ncbi:MAG: restriction endonuclease subunit S [Sodaliphilus sp.]|nr:restriction endonuclease subunit S [Sodaliphilus sp.]